MTFQTCQEIIKRVETPAGEEASSYLYRRDSGDFVVVVIDDECRAAPRESEKTAPDFIVLPLFREYAEAHSQIQAIGFFPLAKDKSQARIVLEHIIDWINSFGDNPQVYFLIDVIFGYGDDTTVEAAPYTIKRLRRCGFQPTRIAYFTRAGVPNNEMEGEYNIISKADVASFIQNNKQFSFALRLFFRMLHDDDVINDAIQLYAKAWEARWDPESWHHNALEKECSDHSKALADWLGIDVNDLCNWEDGESAKALMIWVGPDLWGSRRTIQGNVLKAAMKKLEIPLSETSFPDETLINMPCTPCFPFLVSLRSFLLRCAGEDATVSEIKFIQEDDKCTLRLMINLKDPEEFENRFRETFCEYKESPRQEHTFTRTLIYLIYCKIEGIPNDTNRDYLSLFTKGTEEPVVEVTIEKDYIDLIWCC